MTESSARTFWKRYVWGGFAVLLVHSLAVLLAGTAYPSVRIADPVKIGPNMRMSSGGDVYQGTLIVFGWPFSCFAWREEAEQPIRAARDSPMRVVATSVSGLAMVINLGCVLAVYSLVVLGFFIREKQRNFWRALVVAGVCLAILVCAVCLSQHTFLKPIPVYSEEG